MSKVLRVSAAASLVVGLGAGVLPRCPAHKPQITISMAAPPATPRIQPPFVIGAVRSTPFLYTVPATGQAPLTFAATGLPPGLTLRASSGIISGTAPAAGSYSDGRHGHQRRGSANATLTLVSGTMLRPTPPLGWNSYDSFGASIKESEVVRQAQAMKTTLQPFGWNTVVVDYRWYDPEDSARQQRPLLPSSSKYPVGDGNDGLQIARRSGARAGPELRHSHHARHSAHRRDARIRRSRAPRFTPRTRRTPAIRAPGISHMWGVNGDTAAGQAWYDALFAQYAQWGIDFVKIDDMLNNTHQASITRRKQTRSAASVNKTGRAIVRQLLARRRRSDLAAELRRQSERERRHVARGRRFLGLQRASPTCRACSRQRGPGRRRAGLAPGHWPDADMLPLGYLGPRCEWHASGETTFTHNDQVTIMSLWSILPSPLIFGGNVQSLTTDATTGPWTVALLTNEEVLAVNQDALGTHAKRIVQQGTTEVWARDLSGGRKAVALFNRGTQDATVAVTFAQLGISGTPAVRDLWNRADVTGMTTGISVNVPYSAALMYVLSPPSTGTGGAGGGAVGAGGGTDAGAGGTGAGGSGAAGASGGGTGGATGMGGAAATGGTAGAAATGGHSGAGGAPGETTGSGSGCGCQVGGANGAGMPVLLLFAVAIAAARSRRTVRRSRSRLVLLPPPPQDIPATTRQDSENPPPLT